jgi:hypothetical protein
VADNTIKTVHHAFLEELRTLNKGFVASDNSLLNNYFNVAYPAAVPTSSDPSVNMYPTLKYLGIGNYPISNEFTGGQPPRHRPTDGRLFKHLPWIVRAVGDDLSPAQKANYRLRVEPVSDVTLPNTDTVLQAGYIYYFLRVIDLDAVTPVMTEVTLADGNIVSETSTSLDISDLENPIPVDIENATLNLVTGKHVMVQSAMSIQLNSTDITEIFNACVHLYGSSASAVITEFCLVSGFDQVISGSTEVTHAQACSFIGTNIPLVGMPNAVDLTFALSDSMPKPDTITP